jgi:hypothetical protein
MRYCVFPFWELVGLPRILRQKSSPMPGDRRGELVEPFFSQYLFREVRK